MDMFFDGVGVEMILFFDMKIFWTFAMKLNIFLISLLIFFLIKLFDDREYKIVEFLILKQNRCNNSHNILRTGDEMVR